MAKTSRVLAALLALALATCSGNQAGDSDAGTDADTDADADTETGTQAPPDCPTALVPPCEIWPGSKLEVNEELRVADIGPQVRLVAADREIAIGERLSGDGAANDLVVVPRMGYSFDPESYWSVPIGVGHAVDLAAPDDWQSGMYVALACSGTEDCRLFGITPQGWDPPEVVFLQDAVMPEILEPRGLAADHYDGSFLLFGNGIFRMSLGFGSQSLCPSSEMPGFNAVGGSLAAGDQGRLAAFSSDGCEELDSGTSATLSALRAGFDEEHFAVGTEDGRVGLRQGDDLAWHEVSTASIADLSDSSAWYVLDSAGCVYERSGESGFCVLATLPGEGLEISVWDCGDHLNDVFVTSEGIYDFGAVCNPQ
jgi:hypothetical protein